MSRVCLLVLAGACSASHAPTPDAAGHVPRDPAGSFTVASELDLPVPAGAAAMLQSLRDATDAPDDPARYLIDRMIDQLPDGPVKNLAHQAAPLLAAYLNDRLGEIAPRLAGGLAAISAGLDRVSHHLGTLETWQLDPSGRGQRTITDARFELGGAPIDVRFADRGLPDLTAELQVGLDRVGRVAIGEHGVAIRYGALVRLGLDRAVIPSVDPAAHDLGTALADLVDCNRVGELVADQVGFGSATLYRAACAAAAVAIAGDLYSRLDNLDTAAYVLDLAGTADGYDVDNDGTLDEIRAGAWTGTVRSVGTIGAATFFGQAAKLSP